MPSLKIEFFHDVICARCFVFASRAAMIERFGSMPEAKQTILGYWL